MPNNQSKLTVSQASTQTIGSYLKTAKSSDSEMTVIAPEKLSYLKSSDSNNSILQVLNNILILKGQSYQSRMDTVNPVDTRTPQYGGIDLLFGNSGFEVTGNTTIYLAQGSDSTEAEVRIPMPACTMKELRVASSNAPGTDQSFTYTLIRNGIEVSELQAQISGSGVSATVSLKNGIGFDAGDTFSLRLVTTASAVTAYHSYSIKVI